MGEAEWTLLSRARGRLGCAPLPRRYGCICTPQTVPRAAGVGLGTFVVAAPIRWQLGRVAPEEPREPIAQLRPANVGAIDGHHAHLAPAALPPRSRTATGCATGCDLLSCHTMNAAKTSAQRMNETRERRASLGLVRLELYAHPDDHEALKAHAAKLQRKRVKGGKAPPASG
jgi:hypothetical protein